MKSRELRDDSQTLKIDLMKQETRINKIQYYSFKYFTFDRVKELKMSRRDQRCFYNTFSLLGFAKNWILLNCVLISMIVHHVCGVAYAERKFKLYDF